MKTSRQPRDPAADGRRAQPLDPIAVRAALAGHFADLSGWDRLHERAGSTRHGELRDEILQAFLQHWASIAD